MWIETSKGRRYLITKAQLASGKYDAEVSPSLFQIVDKLPSEEAPPIPAQVEKEEAEEYKPTHSEVEEEYQKQTEKIKQLRREFDSYSAGLAKGREQV